VRVTAIAEEITRLSRATVAIGARPSEVATASLLSVRDLRKTFHTVNLLGASSSHVALDGVSFDVPEGAAVGLVGESGSGKTTIARSILGLSTPDEGLLLLDGHDITDYRRLKRAESRQVRRTVQVVFQDPYASLNPALSIGAALREAVEMRGKAQDVAGEVREALSRVSLPASYVTRYPAALSGGERQRVSIARAICMRPRLLICDEPVAALDVSIQAQVLELLRDIHRDLGMAMLFITHDLAVVRQMTTRVVVLNRGVVVEAGETDVVLDRPQHPYTRRLLDAVPGRTSQTRHQEPQGDGKPSVEGRLAASQRLSNDRWRSGV
jgi:peptide/nickel transport system ATP-binding protein